MPSSHQSARPFSVLEILVALLLAVLVMVSLFLLVHRGQRGFARGPEVSAENPSARAGLDRLLGDLAAAGYGTPPALAVLWADGFDQGSDRVSILYAGPAPPEGAMALSLQGPNGSPECEDVPPGIAPPPTAADLPLPEGFVSELRPECAVSGFYHVVQYRVSSKSETEAPRLERRDLALGEPWSEVAESVSSLQVEYALGRDGTFVDAPALPAGSDPDTWVTRVRVTLAGVGSRAYTTTSSLRHPLETARKRAAELGLPGWGE
jgi:hypothetical protein